MVQRERPAAHSALAQVCQHSLLHMLMYSNPLSVIALWYTGAPANLACDLVLIESRRVMLLLHYYHLMFTVLAILILALSCMSYGVPFLRLCNHVQCSSLIAIADDV